MDALFYRLFLTTILTTKITIWNGFKRSETAFSAHFVYKKTAKTLDFSSFSRMELRGIEPLSESLFIVVSPITVTVLTFPPWHAQRQAGHFSSFINSFQLPSSQCEAYSRQLCKHQYCCAWDCILQILFSSYQISLSLNQSFVAKIRSISISSQCHFYFVLYCFI